MKIKSAKIAVGYVRVSTDEQSAEGRSLDSQTAKIKAYAESQGWDLINIYREEGYSGKTIDRPELSRLIETVKIEHIDVLLVYKVDRLTRRQKDLWTLLEDVLEPNRVGFKSVIESFDTTTATGKAFLSMLGTFAQLERDTIAERTADTLRHKKDNGEWIGRIPFGYRIGGNGRLEKDEEQQKVIAKIRRYQRSGLSVRDIAEKVSIPKSTVSDLINDNGRNRRYANGQRARSVR